MKTNEHYILELLESFDFNELSPENQNLVLKVMSEEEYQNQRMVLLESMHLFAEETKVLKPDPQIRASLRERLREKTTEKPGFFAWLSLLFQYRVPVYQPAIALLLLFAFGYFFQRPKPEIQYKDREVLVYKPKTDTLVVEKVKTERVEVPVQKIVYIPQEQPTVSFQVRNNEYEEKTLESIPLPDTEQIKSSFGNSRIKDHELEQFKVSM